MDWIFSLIERPFIWLSQRSVPPGTDPEARGEGVALDLDTGDPVALGARELARHAYFLGATGCGKTTAILALIAQDIEAGHSLVVLDLRGDLVSGALALCAKLGVANDRVTLLDLRAREWVRGFDPLSGAGEPHIRALHLLGVVADESESWGVQLEETMRSAFLLLARCGQPLTRLGDLLHDGAYRSSLLARCGDADLAAFWDRYGELSADRRQAWAMPVTNKVTSLLAVPVLRSVFSGERDIRLGELLGEPGSVLLVSLAVDELHRSARMLGSLIVSAISREMMARVDVPERERNPVRLYVDEFENMASESFEGLIAEGRRFGLTLVLSHQTLSQLPARLRSVVRNNVGVQAVFQLGYEDAVAVAREIPETAPADLRALEPGHAYLVSRDGTARRVRFHPPGKPPSATRAEAYRNRLGDDRRSDLPPEEGTAPPAEASGSAPEDLL
jgi:hypothetical protein